MRTDVIIDGTSLSDYVTVAGVQVSPITINTGKTTIAGRDGVVLAESTVSERTISVVAVMPQGTMEERQKAIRDLWSLIDVKETHVLSISDDEGPYYVAKLDGSIDTVRTVTSDKLTLNFVTESPAMYGATHSATIPSGSSATIYVDGNYPTYPLIYGNVNGNSDGMWGVRLDSGDYIRVSTGTQNASEVVIDCEERVVSIDGLFSMITLQSDWLMLYHGAHVIENDCGSGSCTVMWKERWL